MTIEQIPEVIKVVPQEDYTVYVHFSDGEIRLFDAKDIIRKGIFKQLKDIETFKKCCKVMNNTLAWDINENNDETECLDIDPLTIYYNK